MIALLLFACHYDNDQSIDPETAAILDVKEYTAAELDALAVGAADLEAAAPTPDADGWGQADSAELEAAWKEARTAYEHIEGAIAVLFPDLDISTDERYEAALGEAPDDDLFDAEGFTGVHAVERIVWSDRQPDTVIAFESALPSYVPAAFPANEEEAVEFLDLVARLGTDTADMRDQFAPLALDSAAAFRGVIGSMAEQYEKTKLASTGQDESRYAQYTLADMRANLAGGRAIYEAFSPWVSEADGGEALDAEILAGFDRVEAAYANIGGDAIPDVPPDWNPDAPSEADLATPYGQLWTLLSTEADPEIAGSLVERMEVAADALDIPQLR